MSTHVSCYTTVEHCFLYRARQPLSLRGAQSTSCQHSTCTHTCCLHHKDDTVTGCEVRESGGGEVLPAQVILGSLRVGGAEESGTVRSGMAHLPPCLRCFLHGYPVCHSLPSETLAHHQTLEGWGKKGLGDGGGDGGGRRRGRDEEEVTRCGGGEEEDNEGEEERE